jgi:hypothetical protein
MSFEDVNLDFGCETISGRASYLDRGNRSFPDVRLYFWALGSFSPSSVPDREDERTGFVFRLPPEFRDVEWAELLEEFESLTATSPDHPGSGEFNKPFYKSVLSSLNPDNRSALRAARLRDYDIRPKPNGGIAVLTIAYNERAMCWSQHDLENSPAKYQREKADETIERFRTNSAVFADPRGVTFDPNASHTVVPDWMRTAIAV